MYTIVGVQIFQSTRPIRGATLKVYFYQILFYHFNPRAPYGARLKLESLQTRSETFQSTRPIRGATVNGQKLSNIKVYFNPRAPYGARPWFCGLVSFTFHFNPRAPYGARRKIRVIANTVRNISIHAPHTGRDDSVLGQDVQQLQISIHAPHTGRDIDRYISPV